MFNNLIESSSHAREFKRRGSFVLFTTGIYAVLFIVAGVASIYAYDARLEDQNLQFVTMLSPTDFPAEPAPARNVAPQRAAPNQVATRQVAMARVDQTQVIPEKTSVTPNLHLPIPKGNQPYVIGDHDSEAVVAGGRGNGTNTDLGNGTRELVVDVGTPPPDPPKPATPPKRIIRESRILNGLALSLPKPPYPTIARQARAQGAVNVQVVIDETGKVVSAKAVSGSPLLMGAAQQAAYGARFSPTKLNDQPVKVSGVIIYNFMLQ